MNSDVSWNNRRCVRWQGVLVAIVVALVAAPSPAAPASDPSVPAGGEGAPMAHEGEPPREHLTLAQGIALALANNRRLIQSRIDRTVQRFALRVAERKFLPSARISASRNYQTEDRGTGWMDGATDVSYRVALRVPTGGEFALANAVTNRDGLTGTAYDSALTFTFTQPLLKGGGIAVNRASVRIARLRERMDMLVFERTIDDVVTAAIRAYRNLIRAQRRVRISARSLQRTKDLLAMNRLLVETGRMAELDVLQTEADVAQRELAAIEAENALAAARLALIDILDIDSRSRLSPTDALNPAEPSAGEREGEPLAGREPSAGEREGEPLASKEPSPKPDLQRSLAVALAHRPDYLQAQLRRESAEQELLLAKNNRLWDLSATFAADVDESGRFGDVIGSFRGIDDGRYRIGLQLQVPIGDLGPRHRLLAAQAALQSSEHDVAELRQSIDIAVRNAVREVDVRFRQVSLAARARELAERKLQAERGKLRLGMSTNFQVIRFEDDLVRAEESDLNAAIAYLNALTTLDTTSGTTLRTWGIDVERL